MRTKTEIQEKIERLEKAPPDENFVNEAARMAAIGQLRWVLE